MSRLRWIWLVSLAAALLVGAAVGTRWRAAPPPAATPLPAQQPAAPVPQAGTPSPFLEIEGTRLAGADEAGRRLWEIRAKTLEVDSSRKRIILTGVTGQFYAASTPQLTFAAPHAIFLVQSKDVALSGGVVATTRDGKTLRASRVAWASSTRLLTATGDVIVTQPGMTIRADKLVSDAGLQQTSFSGNIQVKVTER